MYLIRGTGETAIAHHWTGTDTLCRMWSTGGMNKKRKKWHVEDNQGVHDICTLCQNVKNRPASTKLKMSPPEAEAYREKFRVATAKAPGRFQHFASQNEKDSHLQQAEEARKEGAPF